MRSIKLDNFDLEPYDVERDAHRDVVIRLNKDAGTKEFFFDFMKMLNSIKKRGALELFNEVYIAYYDEKFPIGIITISTGKEYPEISSALLPEYRGKYMGPLLLQEFSEALFEYYEHINTLCVQIDPKNTKAISSATLAGYEKVDENMYVFKR